MSATAARRALALVCLIATALASANSIVSAAPTGEDAGSVAIVDPLNFEREYQRGDSTSAFTLRLPEGASCPGDSANDGWRVQSFIVPVGTDLAALVFAANRPDVGDPASSRSLREINDAIYTQRMTDPNQSTGAPGLILPLPPLTFAHFDTGTFPPGRYEIGVACTTPNWKVRRYWNAEIEFVSAPDVDPGGLRWTFLGDGEAIAGGDDDFPAMAAGIAGVIGIAALIAGGLALRRRRVGFPGAPMSQSQEDFV